MLSMDIQLYSVQIFLFYSPSQPFQIIITATNKVFTALQIAHHFQEDNGIIKEKRITFMSTSVVNFFLLETEIMGSLKMVDISLTENLLYNIFFKVLVITSFICCGDLTFSPTVDKTHGENHLTKLSAFCVIVKLCR